MAQGNVCEKQFHGMMRTIRAGLCLVPQEQPAQLRACLCQRGGKKLCLFQSQFVDDTHNTHASAACLGGHAMARGLAHRRRCGRILGHRNFCPTPACLCPARTAGTRGQGVVSSQEIMQICSHENKQDLTGRFCQNPRPGKFCRFLCCMRCLLCQPAATAAC
jgi:hypothetical protein